jgi:hypothetical protein
MTTQTFSIIRRRSNLIDMVIPKQVGVDGYRIRGAPNFDDTFNDMFTASIGSGFLDVNVDRRTLHTVPGTNRIRAVFDPQTFNGATNIVDAEQFWLTFQPVVGGTPGTETDPVLILTEPQRRGSAQIAINGTALVGADVTSSQRLCLGSRTLGLTIKNDGPTNPMFVAVAPNGPEVEVLAGEVYDFGTISLTDQLLVRTTGGTTTFSATFLLSSGNYLEV